MNYRKIVPAIALMIVLVLAAPSLVRANSLPLPGQPQEPVGTAFTYQGYLTEGGAPAEGAFDFEISMYDAATGGNLADTLYFEDVTVTGGYFTVLLDFGPEPASGEAHWLSIAVRPGAETGAYTTLEPRQALTAVPYATSAATSPWTGLIGIPAGFADGVDDDTNTTYTAGTGLSLTDTEFSVNFGGNGAATTASRSDHTHTTYWRTNGNSQTDPATNYIGTMDNVALVFRVNGLQALRLEPNATSPNIIGGYSGNSVAVGMYGATISGGGTSSYPNQVNWDMGTVGGGLGNTTSGYGATVAGGYSNSASDGGDAVGGGYANTASGGYSTISGGSENAASANWSTVGGGQFNQASGVHSTVGGGYNNTVSAFYATVPGGFGAVASQIGQMAYANGAFANMGDAQTSLYVLRNTSTGTAWTNLLLNGISRLAVASGQVMSFDILIVGGTDAGESAGYRIQGVIENIGGTTALIGSPSVTVLGEDDIAWNVQVLADNTNDALLIQVAGNGETIRWVASVQAAEVTWP